MNAMLIRGWGYFVFEHACGGNKKNVGKERAERTNMSKHEMRGNAVSPEDMIWGIP